VIYLLVIAVLAWALVRRRTEADGSVETGRRLTRAIAAATIASTMTIVGLTAASAVTGHGLTSPMGPAAITVDAVGHQWWWDFQFRDVSPDEFVSSPNELHVPLGQPVMIKTMSRDVIHSFWVPNLQGKRDAIPGDLTSFSVVPEQTGEFEVICGELCGIQHAKMHGTVIVLPAQEFDTWLAEQAERQQRPDREQGGDQWVAVCSKCHGPDVAGEIGPPLEGNPLLADPVALGRLVRTGRGQMPPVGVGWSDQEIESLTAFTSTLAGGDGGGED